MGTGLYQWKWKDRKGMESPRQWKDTVVGRILKYYPIFLSLDLHTQNDPPSFSEGRTCEYDALSLLWLAYATWQRRKDFSDVIMIPDLLRLPQILMPSSRSAYSFPGFDFCFYS